MKFVAFIHNDDANCFHMVVEGTHKFVVIGHITFEDHALIKRQNVGQKMNVTIKKLRTKKKGNHKNSLHLLLEVISVFKVLKFATT